MEAEQRKERLRLELESTRAAFHALLNDLTDADLAKRSNNPGWTNGEILFHMSFAFLILPALMFILGLWGRMPKRFSKLFARVLNRLTAPFNTINGLGARGGGRFYTRERLERRFDRAIESVLKMLDSTKDDEWDRGMYYPTRWDSLFDDYMTREKLFQYPTAHFEFHYSQISH